MQTFLGKGLFLSVAPTVLPTVSWTLDKVHFGIVLTREWPECFRVSVFVRKIWVRYKNEIYYINSTFIADLCDQIWLFLTDLGNKYAYKSKPSIWWIFGAIFKILWLLFCNFGGKLGYFLVDIWSLCTSHTHTVRTNSFTLTVTSTHQDTTPGRLYLLGT